MKYALHRLQRGVAAVLTLVALAAVVGWAPSAAASKDLLQPVPISEPQIPEYELVLAGRRQVALQRVHRIQTWAVAEVSHELTETQVSGARREKALRQERLQEIADLVPEGYRQLVLDVASQYDVDPRLVAAVGTVESRWNAQALGTQQDTGLMQILPSTAAWIAEQMGIAEYDLYDPLTNLTMGTWYLQALRQEYGSWDQALAAYNGGPRAAPVGADFPYVSLVKKVYGHPRSLSWSSAWG